MPVANYNLGSNHIAMIEAHAETLADDGERPNVSAALRDILDKAAEAGIVQVPA